MEPGVKTFNLGPDGDIPNSDLPLIVYSQALPPDLQTAGGCQALFARNLWGSNWVDGILEFWHFHVTGHEVLGCVAGSARVGFGGDGGIQIEVRAGDVVVIPAGIGHKRLSEKHDGFTIGDFAIHEACRRIDALGLPHTDPVVGNSGPLIEAWKLRHAQQR